MLLNKQFCVAEVMVNSTLSLGQSHEITSLFLESFVDVGLMSVVGHSCH